MPESQKGQGYAVSSLEQMGDGPGFRKIRRELGVTAFGINAVVLSAGYETGVHSGGKDGYVGRDGQALGGNPRGGPPGAG